MVLPERMEKPNMDANHTSFLIRQHKHQTNSKDMTIKTCMYIIGGDFHLLSIYKSNATSVRVNHLDTVLDNKSFRLILKT